MVWLTASHTMQTQTKMDRTKRHVAKWKRRRMAERKNSKNKNVPAKEDHLPKEMVHINKGKDRKEKGRVERTDPIDRTRDDHDDYDDYDDGNGPFSGNGATSSSGDVATSSTQHTYRSRCFFQRQTPKNRKKQLDAVTSDIVVENSRCNKRK